MDSFVTRFVEWIKNPYDDSMTALDWFLFVGLILVAIIGWTTILKKVID